MLNRVKVKERGRLYRMICPGDYFFLEYSSYPGFKDKDMGKIAHDLGYEIGDEIELEIIIKKKKHKNLSEIRNQ